MTARFHPQLVNDAFGDPGVHIEFMFEKRAMLFDLGDVSGLSSRKLLRVSDVFISHMHLDHFYGFDRLLRLSLGREHTLRLFGPEGLIDAVSHKLGGYTWNLVDNYAASLTLIVSELVGEGTSAHGGISLPGSFPREARACAKDRGRPAVRRGELQRAHRGARSRYPVPGLRA